MAPKQPKPRSSWLEQPVVRPFKSVDGRQLYELEEPYSYTWTGRRISLPETFVWDGASVPRIVWSLTGLRPGGILLGPSCIHDVLYRESGRLPRAFYAEEVRGVWTPMPCGFTRREADLIFLRMMEAAGVPEVRRMVAYWGVRIGNVGRHWAA